MARFDRVISPGGEGKISLKIDSSHFQGRIHKSAVVFSNDPQKPRITLSLKGTIKSAISMQPSGVVSFRGPAGEIPSQTIDITSNAGPFHIKKLESNLDKDISYQIKTIKEGQHYQLTVANKAGPGNYGGSIKINTDLAKKPVVTVLVFGNILGEVSVRPQAIMVGKLSPGQPPHSAKVLVVRENKKPFHIKKLSYDKQLITVTQQALPEGKGYSLEVSPKLENIPAGTRREQTVLSIETDADIKGSLKVHIYLINLSS